MQIGRHRIEPALILAPMAGITDKPMRRLCRRFGAGYAVSEMLASDPGLWQTKKSLCRRDHRDETGPIGVQIAGAEPKMLAAAARFNVDHGAEIIDINMGCPAKKVLRVWAGSALLRDEHLVGRILDAVVAAVDVPVTLKIRTGWDRDHRNGVAIAAIAESAGVAAVAVHGRTRDQRFTGEAEYETIAAIKQSVSIPVIANGDITNAAQARQVLEWTGADALMIGRAAQGRPWIFREVARTVDAAPDAAPDAALNTALNADKDAVLDAGPDGEGFRAVIVEHLEGLYELYGETQGVRVARKHIGWYLSGLPDEKLHRNLINQVETASEQLHLVDRFIDRLAAGGAPTLAVAA